jgi:endonuclease YncB( thermonuclease family)
MVFGKTVAVDTCKTDRYAREVGKILVDGMDANLEKLKKGLVWHYKAYQREQSPEDRLTYAAAKKTPQRPAWACGKMPCLCRLGTGGIR